MITVPTLLLDEEKCRRNIRMMAEKARNSDVVFRPHFKTHVSHEIGNWFMEEGVEKITVSSLRMAQYFASGGWKDILVAFPVNILEIELINILAADIDLSVLVESPETVRFLVENLNSRIGLYIKIDSGLRRTGIPFNNPDAVREILNEAGKSGLISLRGFLTHAGHSYKATCPEEISRIHYESISGMAELKYRFMNEFPGLIISTGDTPTCSVMDDFSMTDEIRPGNFVFYDLMQTTIGSCTPDMVAVAMACPVVAVHPERNELVIYGGAVHFSKESITDASGRTIYGAVLEDNGPGWGATVQHAVLSKLSQEHGIVGAPSEFIDRFKPGDIIKIMPVHSCLTAHAMGGYLTLTGRTITMMA
ncbi:MAG: alanine racemase [Bacteroidales bacterium]|nr:alanine racemase [Bacteroidales bacterium]